VVVKKTQEIGAFPAYAPEKPEKPGFFGSLKSNRAAWEVPRGPIYEGFSRF
jgi:hypothetical protein